MATPAAPGGTSPAAQDFTGLTGSRSSTLKKAASAEDGLFGVLYTLSKDKRAPSQKAAAFIMLVEVLQLLVFLLSPKFPWGNGVSQLVSQLRNLQLQNPLVALGYTTYVVTFWTLAAVLLACVGICAYVAYSFHENKFTLVWPIVFVRQVVSVLITILFTSSLNIFLASFDCKVIGQSRPMLMSFGASTASGGAVNGDDISNDASVTYSIPCWELPHAFTSIGGIVMSIVFTSLALIVSLVEFEPDLRRRNPLGCVDARAEFIFFCAKTTQAVANVLLSSYTLVVAIIFAVATTLMFATVIIWLPYRESWANHFKGALYAVLVFSSCVLLAVVLKNTPTDNTLVVVEGAGIIPAFITGWLLVSIREESIDGRWLFSRRDVAALLLRQQGAGAGAAAAREHERDVSDAMGLFDGGGSPGQAAAAAARGHDVLPPLWLQACLCGGCARRGAHARPAMLSQSGASASGRLLVRHPSFINSLLHASVGSSALSANARSPFTSPDQVERATRFVALVDLECKLPDDIVLSLGRSLTAARGAGRGGPASARLLTNSRDSVATVTAADAAAAVIPFAAEGDTVLPDVDDLLGAGGGDGGSTLLPGVVAGGSGGDVGSVDAGLRDGDAGGDPPRGALARLLRCLLPACCLPASMAGGAGRGRDRRLSDASAHQEALKRKLLRALQMADIIFQHGLAVFPDVASLHLAYATFILGYGGTDAAAKFHLDRARRLNTSFQDRFLLFLRNTARKHKATGESIGESTLDLVSYVEFQNNMETAVTTHRATLKAMRRFWRVVDAIGLNKAAITRTSRGKQHAASVPTGSEAQLTRTTSNASLNSANVGSKSARSISRGSSIGISRFLSRSSFGSQSMSAIDMANGGGGGGDDGSEGAGGGGVGGDGGLAGDGDSVISSAGAGSWLLALWNGSRSDTTLGAHDLDGVELLARSFERIDKLESKCNTIYTLLLEKYPRSVKLLRAYAAFASDILNDRKKAARALAEADRLEEQQRDGQRFGGGEGGAGGAGGAAGGDGAAAAADGSGYAAGAAEGLIVINDKGIITSASRGAVKMLGYHEKELVGRNVSMIMGPPHNALHNTYIANYLSTGVAHVLGTRRRVEARHKDGHMFGVELNLSMVESDGGTSFAGVLKKLADDELTARIQISRTGIMQTVNMAAVRMFGYTSPADLLHKNVAMLMPPAIGSRHDGFLRAAAEGRGSGALALSNRRLEGAHKNGFTFPLTISVEAVGSGEAMVYEGVITELTQEYGMVTIDARGEILTVNSGLLALFGYRDPRDLVGNNVMKLMPLPYSAFHSSYLARYMTTGRGTIVGRPRQLLALHSDGSTFPIKLEVSELAMRNTSGGGGSAAAAPATAMKSGGSGASAGAKRGQSALETASTKVYAGKITLITEMAAQAVGAAGSAAAASSADKLNDILAGRVSIDKRGTILSVNTVLLSMLGYTEEGQLVGKNVKMLMMDDVAAMHDEILRAYAERRTPRVIGTGGRQLYARKRDGASIAITLRVFERPVPAAPGSGKTTPGVYFPQRVVAEVRKPASIAPSPGAASGPGAAATTTAHRESGAGAGAGAGRGGTGGLAAPFAPLPAFHPAVPSGAGIGGCPVFRVNRTIEPDELQRLMAGGSAAWEALRRPSRGTPAAASEAESITGEPARIDAPHATAPPPAAAAGADASAPDVLADGAELVVGDGDAAAVGIEDAEEVAATAQVPALALHARAPGQVLADEWDGYDAYIFALEDLEALVTINAAGIVVDVSPAACALFGYWKEELIGQNVKALMPPAIAEVHDEYLANYRQSRVKRMLGNRRVVEARHRDGSTLKIVAEVAELQSRVGGTTTAVTSSARTNTGGSMEEGNHDDGEVETFFMARVVLSTQARSDVESQSKAAAARLVQARRRAKMAKRKDEAPGATGAGRGGSDSDREGATGRRSKPGHAAASAAAAAASASAAATGASGTSDSVAVQSMNLARSMGLVDKRGQPARKRRASSTDGAQVGAAVEGGDDVPGGGDGPLVAAASTSHPLAPSSPAARRGSDSDAAAGVPAATPARRRIQAGKGVRFAASPAAGDASDHSDGDEAAAGASTAPTNEAGSGPFASAGRAGQGAGVANAHAAREGSVGSDSNSERDDEGAHSDGGGSGEGGASESSGDTPSEDLSQMESELARLLMGESSTTDGGSQLTGDGSSVGGGSEGRRRGGGGGSDGGHHDDAGSESASTPARQSAFLARHRERALRQMSRAARIATTTQRLFRWGAIVAALAAAIVATPFAVMEVLNTGHLGMLSRVYKASSLATHSMLVSSDARRFMLATAQLAAAAGASASSTLTAPNQTVSWPGGYVQQVALWYAPFNSSASPAAGTTAAIALSETVRAGVRLGSEADWLEEQHRELFLHVSTEANAAMTTSNTDDEELLDVFVHPQLALVRRQPAARAGAAPLLTVARASFWEVGRWVTMHAQNTAHRATGVPDVRLTMDFPAGTLTAINVATDSGATVGAQALQSGTQRVASIPTVPISLNGSSFTAAVPLSVLAPFSESARFVLSNGPDSLAAGCAGTIAALARSTDGDLVRFVALQAVVFVLQLATPLSLVVLFLRPLLQRATQERQTMFRVFVRIPHEVLNRLSKLVITVGDDASDGESSDDEEGGNAKSAGTPAKTAAVTRGRPEPSRISAASASTEGDADGGVVASRDDAARLAAARAQHASAAAMASASSGAESTAAGPEAGTHGGRSGSRREGPAHSTCRRCTTTTRLTALRLTRACCCRSSATVAPDAIADATPQRVPIRVPRQLLWMMGLLAALITALFITSVMLLMSTKNTATLLRIAGLRASLAGRVKFFSQEVVVAASALRHGIASPLADVVIAAASTGTAFQPELPSGISGVRGDLISNGSEASALSEYLAYAREGLIDAATKLRRYHRALLYGDADLAVASLVTNSRPQGDLLFGLGCLRTNGAACVPASHPYHRVTTQGLHVLVEQYVEQALQLANQTATSLAASRYPGSTLIGMEAVSACAGALPSGTTVARHEFVWAIAECDLRDGLASSYALYYAEASAASQAYAVANGIIFACFLLALVAAYLLIFRPFIFRISAESHRAASLLRNLPADLDLDLLQDPQVSGAALVAAASGADPSLVAAVAGASRMAKVDALAEPELTADDTAQGRRAGAVSAWQADKGGGEGRLGRVVGIDDGSSAVGSVTSGASGGLNLAAIAAARRAAATVVASKAAGAGSILKSPAAGSGAGVLRRATVMRPGRGQVGVGAGVGAGAGAGARA